jgi:hypothetical protein
VANSSVIDRLQRFFGFTSKSAKNTGHTREIVPIDRQSKDGKKPLNLPSELKRIWDWWLNENHDTAQTLKNRDDRIKDLEYMRFNDGVISMAAELYADESVRLILRTTSSRPLPRIELSRRESISSLTSGDGISRRFGLSVTTSHSTVKPSPSMA